MVSLIRWFQDFNFSKWDCLDEIQQTTINDWINALVRDCVVNNLDLEKLSKEEEFRYKDIKYPPNIKDRIRTILWLKSKKPILTEKHLIGYSYKWSEGDNTFYISTYLNDTVWLIKISNSKTKNTLQIARRWDDDYNYYMSYNGVKIETPTYIISKDKYEDALKIIAYYQNLLQSILKKS